MIPWLDRRARRDRDSPAFTDLGVAALLFIGFLTLKAWDVGVQTGADDPASRAVVARLAAWWTLGGFAVATALRALTWRHRWFALSVSAALHAALHGLAGLSYLTAGVLAAAAGGAVFVMVAITERAPIARREDTRR